MTALQILNLIWIALFICFWAYTILQMIPAGNKKKEQKAEKKRTIFDLIR